MKKDKLNELFQLQKKFDRQLAKKRNLYYPQIFKRQEKNRFSLQSEWILMLSRAIQHELMEIEDLLPWKWWKNYGSIDDDVIKAIKEELIDILHFWLSMCHKLDMTPDEVMKIYKEKNKENFDRQNGKSIRTGYKSK